MATNDSDFYRTCREFNFWLEDTEGAQINIGLFSSFCRRTLDVASKLDLPSVPVRCGRGQCSYIWQFPSGLCCYIHLFDTEPDGELTVLPITVYDAIRKDIAAILKQWLRYLDESGPSIRGESPYTSSDSAEDTTSSPKGLQSSPDVVLKHPKVDENAHSQGTDATSAETPLTDRARWALKALLEQKALDSDHRISTATIAEKVDAAADPNQYKPVIAELQKIKLIETKMGRGGGCWLTSTGRTRAEKL
jgi:hypothetical protein